MDEPVRQDYGVAQRIQLALNVMNYNQGFVVFADGKANTLLVVNSIILATSAGAAAGSRLALSALAAATVAIVLSLWVVWARSASPARREKARLAFWAHILQRPDWGQYLRDLREVEPEAILESTAHQIHDLAQVVSRKFFAYRLAQAATFCATALWIVSMVRPLVH